MERVSTRSIVMTKPHAFAFALTGMLAGCSTLDEHLEVRPWRLGYESFTEHREQWIPVAATAVATPLLFPFDHQNTAESVHDQFFNSNTKYGDELALGLGLAPIVWGGLDAAGGGDTTFLEVSSETAFLTLADTYALKAVINRERPDGSSQDSFPSGHTSFAFAGATLFARRWQDEHDGSLLGYWLYLPASYVGISRLEGERHWLSDITFGAALGMLTAHLVHNAHYGDADTEGLFGRDGKGWYSRAAPIVTQDELGIALHFAF